MEKTNELSLDQVLEVCFVIPPRPSRTLLCWSVVVELCCRTCLTFPRRRVLMSVSITWKAVFLLPKPCVTISHVFVPVLSFIPSSLSGVLQLCVVIGSKRLRTPWTFRWKLRKPLHFVYHGLSVLTVLLGLRSNFTFGFVPSSGVNRCSSMSIWNEYQSGVVLIPRRCVYSTLLLPSMAVIEWLDRTLTTHVFLIRNMTQSTLCLSCHMPVWRVSIPLLLAYPSLLEPLLCYVRDYSVT